MDRQSQQTNFQAHQRQARKNSRRLTLAFIAGISLSAFAYFAVTFLALTYSDFGKLASAVVGGTQSNTTLETESDGNGSFSFEFHSSVSTEFEINTMDDVELEENLEAADALETLPKDNSVKATKTRYVRGAVIISSFVALLCCVIILWGFYRKKGELVNESAIEIAQHFGAQYLPKQRNLRQQQYVNVVEEMAIASGLECPEMLYLPNDDSINAFVTGGYDEEVSITISQGALDYLNREELQAIVAHEFGHIFNRDVFLNNRLTAVLHGFFVVRSLMTDDSDSDYDDDYYDDDDDYYYEDDDDGRSFGFGRNLFSQGVHFHAGNRLGFWGLGIIVISAGSIFCGKVLQAAFSRQREWLADAHAVQYTRNKDALVGVFSKAMALQQMQVYTPEVPNDSAHFLFINYQSKWFSTHPPMEERIARYGKKLFQDDLEAIGYRLKQIKHDQEQALVKEQQRQKAAKAMMTQGGGLLSLADDGGDTAVGDGNSQQRFIAEKFIPLLALREYQKNLVQHPVASPNHAACAVLAQFVALSNVSLEKFATAFKWSEKQSKAIQQYVESLSEQHPSTHIQTFLHQLPMLQQYPSKQALIKQIQAIIKADKSFDLCEMSYLLCLRSGLQKKVVENERQADFKHYENDIALLLTVAAYISHEDDHGRASNFELMKNQAMPMLSATYSTLEINDEMVKKLYQGIQNLSNCKTIYRKSLLATIEKNMLLDGKLSTEQNHLLFALKHTLS